MGTFMIENTEDSKLDFSYVHDKRLVHFLICLKGEVEVCSGESIEVAKLSEKVFSIFSYPFDDSTLYVTLTPGAILLCFMLELKQLHALFGSGFGADEKAAKDFIDGYKMKNYFIDKDLTPNLAIIGHQFFKGINSEALLKMYQQSKIMEFLSHYLDVPKPVDEVAEKCPFIKDAFEIARIKEARDILLKNMMDPPSLKELARKVGTNEFKLKIGFKNVFGNTVYGYLTDYRLNKARQLLTIDNVHIKDVASQIGYSNPSHFIAAYKKKFGVTPKQHVKSLI